MIVNLDITKIKYFYKSKLWILGIIGLVILATATVVYAVDVTTQASSTNVAPVVNVAFINNTSPSSGVAFFVSAEVTDQNGKGDIFNGNITCVGTGGTEGTNNWDSIKLANSSLTWTSINSTTYRFNGTFTTSIDFWSTKSINGTWTCKVYANDTASASASASTTMTVSTSTGISLFTSTCVFDSATPGTNDKQWKCPSAGDRNLTTQHDGNIKINVTISGTNLVGQTDNSFNITVGNITWNQTTGAVPSTEAGTALTTSAVNYITFWPRGTSPTSNTTNTTTWIDYPLNLKVQTYQGTITLTSSAS